VIQEAVALRLKSKSDQEGDSAIEVLQVLEQPDEQERINAIREQIEAEAQQQAHSRFEMLEFGLKQKIAHLEAQLAAVKSSEIVKPSTTGFQSSTPLEVIESPTTTTGLHSARTPEATLESSARAGLHSARTPEPVEETRLQPSSDLDVAASSDNLSEDPDIQVTSLALEQPREHECSPANANCSEPVAPTNLDNNYLEPVASPSHPQLSEEASTASKQILAADWDLIQELRAAESSLQKIDAKIQNLNYKLAQSGSNVVESELKQLRSLHVSEIVDLINSNGISGYYEEQPHSCRVVLDPKYASALLWQAQSWADVVLIVGRDGKQLLSALKDWTRESRQLLVQLLSTHLETDPDSFNRIDWIPEKILNKALSSLSFTLEKIRSSDNLVDEPELEYIRGCIFVSLQKLGTRHEQWVFSVDGKSIPAFSRSEFTVEKF